MLTDNELLRQFADARDEAAFAELVRRQADFVYSVARRVTVSDALAQEVTQAVFTLVAQQAARLASHGAFEGWLHTTARNLAINTVRGEVRRRAREQEALAMEINAPTPEARWEEIGPLLDEAVSTLPGDDRQAVLLRFFKNLSHREVGAALGVNEDAARKRVDRALEKLRAQFAKRGVTASSALLSTTIIENSVQAAPAGLAASVTSASLASMGGAVTSGALLTALFMTTKTKTILAAVVVLAIVATLAIKLQRTGEPSASVSAAATPAVKTLPAIAATLSKAPPAQVAAPVVAPAPTGGSSGPAAPAVISSGTLMLDAAPANADLKTSIPAIIQYLETDDFVHMVPLLLPPDELQHDLQTGQTMQQFADKFRTELNNHGGASALLQAMFAIQNEAPIMDETGDQASYVLDPPVSGHKEVTFKKINGLWYGPQ